MTQIYFHTRGRNRQWRLQRAFTICFLKHLKRVSNISQNTREQMNGSLCALNRWRRPVQYNIMSKSQILSRGSCTLFGKNKSEGQVLTESTISGLRSFPSTLKSHTQSRPASMEKPSSQSSLHKRRQSCLCLSLCSSTSPGSGAATAASWAKNTEGLENVSKERWVFSPHSAINIWKKTPVSIGNSLKWSNKRSIKLCKFGTNIWHRWDVYRRQRSKHSPCKHFIFSLINITFYLNICHPVCQENKFETEHWSVWSNRGFNVY